MLDRRLPCACLPAAPTFTRLSTLWSRLLTAMEHSPSSSYTTEIFEACKEGFFQDIEQALLAVRVKLQQQGEPEALSHTETTLSILKRGLGHLLYEMRAHQLPVMACHGDIEGGGAKGSLVSLPAELNQK